MSQNGVAGLIALATRFKLVAGCGTGRMELNAFDAALVDAGVGNYNLLRVSSIYPPACTRAESIDVPFGSPLLIAYGSHTATEPGVRIAAAVSIGIPEDPDLPGVIMEYSQHGNLGDTVRIVEGMAEEAMAIRHTRISEILAIGKEQVAGEHPAAVFAGVAMWR